MSVQLSPGQAACARGEHEEATDPRRAGRCIRCDRPITDRQELLPLRGIMRDPRFEQEIVRLLCGSLKVDWEQLNAFAGRRADAAKREYGRDFPDIGSRNMAQEGADECGDAVNYARWWLDAFNRGLIPDSEHWKAEHFQAALKYSALAFHEFAQAV